MREDTKHLKKSDPTEEDDEVEKISGNETPSMKLVTALEENTPDDDNSPQNKSVPLKILWKYQRG